MRYAIVIEKAGRNFSAYVPDLPGCISTGRTVEETKRRISEAVEFHLDGMIEDGIAIPNPNATVSSVRLRRPKRVTASRSEFRAPKKTELRR